MRDEEKETKSFREKLREHKLAILITLLIIGIASGLFFGLGVRTVPSGYKGVKTQWGSVIGMEDEGFHWVNCILGEDIVNINTQIKLTKLDNESIGTIDQQEAWGTISINYQLEKGYVDEIFKTLRMDWEERIIVPKMRDSLKDTTAKFRADEFLLNRTQVGFTFKSLLTSRLEQYHILLIDVQLENFKFSDKYQEQVNARSEAEQKALTEKNNLEIIRYQQEQEILKQEASATMQKIQAEAYANVTLTEATANALKVTIEATAQADALRLINSQLTAIYLKYMALEEWDGKLPYYYGSDLPLPFLDVSP